MSQPPAPYSLLCELTHRCPLHCPYCSNPVQLTSPKLELTTYQWVTLLHEASALGVVQIGLSGGEPLLRTDLESICETAASLDLYTNLITSGVGLTTERAQRLAQHGLDSVQISFQSWEPHSADRIAGFKAHSRKLAAIAAVHDSGLTLNMNVVLHRLNIDDLTQIVQSCVDCGAERVELANTQYYGWGLRNRRALMPSRAQVVRAEHTMLLLRERFRGKVELVWVPSDYHDGVPKPCMGGWGRLAITVAPDGKALPCSMAGSIRGLSFDSVVDSDLEWIWYHSPAFSAFRGFSWMQEPCRSCVRREIDYGGCRCQAYLLTGDATRADPVCRLSPDHNIVAFETEAADTAERGSIRLSYRHQSHQ